MPLANGSTDRWRGPGQSRERLDAELNIAVSRATHDRLWRLAELRDRSLSGLVRDLIDRRWRVIWPDGRVTAIPAARGRITRRITADLAATIDVGDGTIRITTGTLPRRGRRRQDQGDRPGL